MVHQLNNLVYSKKPIQLENFRSQTHNPVNLENLISSFDTNQNNLTLPLVTKWLKNFTISPEIYNLTPDFGRVTYSYRLVHQDDLFNLVLFRWNLGQNTIIHSHNDSKAFVKVIEGKFVSSKYEIDVNRASLKHHKYKEILEVGSISTVDLDEAHQLTCIEPAISLHIYARPLNEITVFDLHSGVSENRIMRCRI